MREAQPDFRFEQLRAHHDRESFTCGVPALDHYLHRQARQDARKNVAAVYVLTSDGKQVAGYYTLSHFSVELDSLPEATARRLPKYPQVPATLVGRLAISSAFRGQGLGELLLMDALKRSLDGSKRIASAAVIVDAKDGAAVGFYKKYGFLQLIGIANRLFLPMATIENMFG